MRILYGFNVVLQVFWHLLRKRICIIVVFGDPVVDLKKSNKKELHLRVAYLKISDTLYVALPRLS
jgi:hypothetical protein